MDSLDSPLVWHLLTSWQPASYYHTKLNSCCINSKFKYLIRIDYFQWDGVGGVPPRLTARCSSGTTWRQGSGSRPRCSARTARSPAGATASDSSATTRSSRDTTHIPAEYVTWKVRVGQQWRKYIPLLLSRIAYQWLITSFSSVNPPLDSYHSGNIVPPAPPIWVKKLNPSHWSEGTSSDQNNIPRPLLRTDLIPLVKNYLSPATFEAGNKGMLINFTVSAPSQLAFET